MPGALGKCPAPKKDPTASLADRIMGLGLKVRVRGMADRWFANCGSCLARLAHLTCLDCLEYLEYLVCLKYLTPGGSKQVSVHDNVLDTGIHCDRSYTHHQPEKQICREQLFCKNCEWPWDKNKQPKNE